MKTDYLNIIVTALLILSDASFYGYAYEIKHWFKSWLFWEWKPGTKLLWLIPNKDDKTYVPYYRLFIQWPLDGLALYLVWGQGFLPFFGMILAWACMVKEGGFYLVLGQWGGLKKDEAENKDMWWLKRAYFTGSFLFTDRFSVKKFAWSCIIGLAILVISNFI